VKKSPPVTGSDEETSKLQGGFYKKIANVV